MELVALVTWVCTALVGGYMFGIVGRTGRAEATATRTNLPTWILGTHPLLGLSGIALWIIYLLNGAGALAWAAFLVLVTGAALGDVMAWRWHKGRKNATARTGERVAEQQIPTIAVATHGVLAGTTMVLVFLVALGVG